MISRIARYLIVLLVGVIIGAKLNWLVFRARYAPDNHFMETPPLAYLRKQKGENWSRHSIVLVPDDKYHGGTGDSETKWWK